MLVSVIIFCLHFIFLFLSLLDSPLRSPVPGDDIHTPLELLPLSDDAIVSADEQECYNYVQEYDDDVFAVELEKDEQGLGLGLIDGLVIINLM